MSKPTSGDIDQAFITALNESRWRYLLVGELAWVRHHGPCPRRSSEAWLEPGVGGEALLIYARTYQLLKAKHEGLTPDFMKDKVKIHLTISGLDFDAAFAQRLGFFRRGQPTALVSADDLIAIKMSTGRSEDAADAKRLRMFLSSESDDLGPEPGHSPGRRR